MEDNNQIISQNKTHPLFFWGICLILFLPIIVLPPSFQPADWSRAVLFRSIITILLSFLLFKYLYKKDISFSIPEWKNPVCLPFLILAAFFITLILATIFSEDIRFSIFGSPVRAGGVLNLLFFFIFTVFLALFIKEKDWKKLFNLLFAAGILASSLAVIQYFNIFKNLFIAYKSGDAPSFLGNSTFLAIYMIFLSMLSFTLLTQEKKKKKKILYGALFLLFIFTILITGSRATYLGLSIGFFYFFFFYPKKLKTLKIIAASLVLLAIIVIIFFNFFPQIAEQNNLLKIAVNRLSVKRIVVDLAGTRFSAWKITLQTIKEKPVLGWGPENSYIGFDKYYDPTISNVKNMWWDRPHNIFLEIAATSGIISAILYSLFWIFLLWQLQIFKRKNGNNENTYLAHGIQAMLIGYLIVLFFNFNNFSTYLISFFFIGCAFYLISEKEEKITIYPPKAIIPYKKYIAAVFLIILILFLWFWNIKPLYINEKIIYAYNLSNIKKCDKAISISDSTLKNGILKAYAGLKYADTIKNCVPSKPEKSIEYSTTSLQALKLSSEIQPKFTRTWLFMGNFANFLAAKEQNAENKNKLLLETRDYLEKALKLSPKRQEILIEMEKNYLMVNDYQTMKKIAYDCIAIDSSYGFCYWYLGVAEVFLGEQENGKKHIQEAREKADITYPYIQLGIAYINQKNYKDAAEAYRLAVIGDGENANYRAVLAFLYKQIGEYEKAGIEAVEVFKLQPGNKEVLEFIKLLLGLSPNSITLHTSLAYVYTQTGETEKARQEYLIIKSIYSQAVTKYPKNPNYHFNLAGVCKELGEYEKAYQEALLAEKLDPNFHDNVSNFIYFLPGDYWKKYLKR